MAAQHVESWTASILLLQQALAEAGEPPFSRRNPGNSSSRQVLLVTSGVHTDMANTSTRHWKVEKLDAKVGKTVAPCGNRLKFLGILGAMNPKKLAF